MDSIHVKGASEHNLKSIDVEIPRDQLTVVTGLSGSGKSSLAFDTIYQEGQRRFMESLSAYARQFLGSMEKPRVERVDGLSPTLSIDQKTVNRNPRSTVGTVTEIFDHQRLLMARLGTPRCPLCRKPIQSLSPGQIADRLIEDSLGARLHVMAPVVQERKGEYRKELKDALRKGFIRARVNGVVRSLEEGDISLARYEKHTIELVLDRLKCTPEERSRLVEAIETALPMAAGVVTVLVSPAGGGEDVHRTFSSNRSCVDHDIAIPEMEPRLFSFNAPQGMCPTCSGIGWIEDFDLDLLIDEEAKVLDALVPLREDGRMPFSTLSRDVLAQVVQRLGISARTRWKDLLPADRDKLLHGAKVRYEVVRERDTRTSRSIRTWSGILPIVRYVWQFAHLNRLASCRRRVHCETCRGQRLNPIALAVDFRGRNIADLTAMTVIDASTFFGELALGDEEARIGAPIVKEIVGAPRVPRAGRPRLPDARSLGGHPVRAAKRSASGSPHRSEPGSRASRTSSTSPASGSTRAITSVSSTRSACSATRATRSSSSSTTRPRWRARTSSWRSDRAPAARGDSWCAPHRLRSSCGAVG